MTDNKEEQELNITAGLPRQWEMEWFLTPAECNPQGRMPLTLLINRLIEIATLHANAIGIGYADIVGRHHTWVLSRVAVEMKRYPGVNDTYRISTWICSVNRLFSERDFCIMTADGEVLGWARTVWGMLDTDTRQAADISYMAWIEALAQPVRCPIDKASRPQSPGEYTTEHYRFTYCDLDFNRHVNSSRYIELLLNQWPLEFHDANRLTRFEIAYLHEAYSGEEVEVRLSTAGSETRAELTAGSTALCRARLCFSPREPEEQAGCSH